MMHSQKHAQGLILKLEGKLEEALPLLLEGLRNDEDVSTENGKILLPLSYPAARQT